MSQNEISIKEQAAVAGLIEECKEIEVFFEGVDEVKSKIMNDKLKGDLKDKVSLSTEEIKMLLISNVNIINVISDDTIRIYIETIFEKELERDLYKFTEKSVETLLTSILIFKQD
jgi:hypothetical protein